MSKEKKCNFFGPICFSFSLLPFHKFRLVLECAGQILMEAFGGSLVVQMVKNLPAMQETWVRSLSQEDPLEKGMTTCSSILAWRIPQTRELGRLQSMRLQRVGQD